MTNPEIKVGQKYRVVDAIEFGYRGVAKDEILEVFTRELIEDDDHYYGISEDEMIITPSEILEGIVELVEDTQELSKDAQVFSKGQVWEVRGHLLGESVRTGSYVWVDAVTINSCGEAAKAYAELTKETLVHLKDSDVAHGRIRKVADNLYEYFARDTTAPYKGVPPAWASSVPVGVETHAQASTGSPTDIFDAADTCVGISRSSVDSSEGIRMYKNGQRVSIQSGLSAELLWKFIEGSGDYNGHKQLEIKELPWDVLKESVRVLGDYLETDEDTLASSLEIRLMYNGDSGKFAGTWSASVYQLYYWSDGEHRDGHKYRLLFGVEIVREI
jgi:hypothetical protein